MRLNKKQCACNPIEISLTKAVKNNVFAFPFEIRLKKAVQKTYNACSQQVRFSQTVNTGVFFKECP